MQKNLLQPLPASTSLFYFSTSFSFQFWRSSFCFRVPTFSSALTFSFLLVCCHFFSPKYFFSPKISPCLWFSASFSLFLFSAPFFFLFFLPFFSAFSHYVLPFFSLSVEPKTFFSSKPFSLQPKIFFSAASRLFIWVNLHFL